MAKKKINPIIWFIALFACLIMVISGSYIIVGNTFALSGTAEFAEPIIGRFECLKDATPVVNTEKRLADNDNLIVKCEGNIEPSDGCKIEMIVTESSFISDVTVRYYVCDIEGSNCGKYNDVKLSSNKGCIDINDPNCAWTVLPVTIKPQTSIKIENVETGLGLDKDYAIKKTFYPWSLYDDCATSGKNRVNEKSCKLPIDHSILGNFLSVDKPSSTFNFGEYKNYVCNYVKGYGTNIFNHPEFGEVYCSYPNIYEIISITDYTGKEHKLDPTYKKILNTANGQVTINGLGKKLGNVKCCPYMPNCDEKTFDFKQDVVKHCTSDAQCINLGNPYSAGQKGSTNLATNQYCDTTKNECIEKQPYEVQCNENGDCTGDLKCDLSVQNYGKCVKSEGQQICGNGKCETGENGDNCARDCRDNNDDCKEGFHTVTKTKKGLLSTETTEQCEPDSDSLLLYVLLILGGLTGGYLLMKKSQPSNNTSKLFN